MIPTAAPTLTCREVVDALGAYALGALDRDEIVAVEEHLTTCPACSLALAEQHRTVDALAGAIRPVEPSPDVRARLMAAARREPTISPVPLLAPVPITAAKKPARSIPRWVLPAVSIAATLLLVGVGVLAVLLTRTIDQRDQAAETARLLSTYVSAGGQVVTLQAQPVSLYQSYNGKGSLLTAPGKDPVVVVAGCPESGDYLTYWVWFARGGERVPAGKLTVGGDGSGWIELDSGLSLSDYDTIGITIQTDKDQREDVLVAPLSASSVD
jgi:hypothetical protein